MVWPMEGDPRASAVAPTVQKVGSFLKYIDRNAKAGGTALMTHCRS